MIKIFLEFGKFVCISGQVNLAKFTWPDPELKCELYLYLCTQVFMSFSNNGILFTPVRPLWSVLANFRADH